MAKEIIIATAVGVFREKDSRIHQLGLDILATTKQRKIMEKTLKIFGIIVATTLCLPGSYGMELKQC